MYYATMMQSQSGSDVNGKSIAVDLGPELLPTPLRVNQSSQTEHRCCAFFLPLGPAAAHAHLDDGLAGRFRHTAANGQLRRQPLRILHLLLMVREVRLCLLQLFLS